MDQRVLEKKYFEKKDCVEWVKALIPKSLTIELGGFLIKIKNWIPHWHIVNL